VDGDVFLATESRFAERKPHLNPEILPSSNPSGLAATAGEHLGEEVLHVREDVAHAPVEPTAAHAAFETCMAKLVVNPSFVVVGQNLVRLVDFFEKPLRLGIALVAIRVMLEGFLLVGPANLIGRGSASTPEDFVIATLRGHRVFGPPPGEGAFGLRARVASGPSQ
jgi:hypothetical protein